MSQLDTNEELEVVSEEGGATSDEWYRRRLRVKEGSSECNVRASSNGLSNASDESPVEKLGVVVQEVEKKGESSADLIKAVSFSSKQEPSRHDQWVNLLGVRNKPDPMMDWDNLYNLKNQTTLRRDCRALLDSLNGATTMTVPQLESIVTLYCKKRRVDYEPESGWLHILGKLIVMPFDPSTLFNVFYAITTKYIPRCSKMYDLFRLLLQYHDPQSWWSVCESIKCLICSHLDSMKIQPQHYVQEWFLTLLSKDTEAELCWRVWDQYFERGDPFLIFFISLVFVRNAREEILSESNKGQIVSLLRRSPRQMSVDDLGDLLDICYVYLNYTPLSVRQDFHCMLFGSNLVDEYAEFPLHRLICLPISAHELYKRVIDTTLAANCAFSYFIIDTRTQKRFTAGSVSGSYNLTGKLIVDDPQKFDLAMNSLLRFKEDSCKEDHICFLSSGLEEDDSYTMMVISRFLHRNIENVSYVDGGYRALHTILADTGNLSKLSNHFNPLECHECGSKQHRQTEARGSSLLDRVKSAIHAKRNEVEAKILARQKPITSITYNHDEGSTSTVVGAVKHVQSNDRFGKRYRNIQSVFSINDDSQASGDEEVNLSDIEDYSLITEVPPERLRWADVKRNAEISDHFEGVEVLPHAPDKRHVPCYIAISRTHMHIFHAVKNESGFVRAQFRHPLSSIMRVTSKKKIPEFLTFKFGYELPTGEAHINKVHCFILPKAGDCAKAIKTAIIALKPSLLDEDGGTAGENSL